MSRRSVSALMENRLRMFNTISRKHEKINRAYDGLNEDKRFNIWLE
jgi:hypothetical protein